MKAKFPLLIAMTTLLGLAVSANATLTPIGSGTIGGTGTSYNLIYDSGQNLTWLDYTHWATTWGNQVSWAENLSVNFNGTTLTGWRLPTTDNISSS